MRKERGEDKIEGVRERKNARKRKEGVRKSEKNGKGRKGKKGQTDRQAGRRVCRGPMYANAQTVRWARDAGLETGNRQQSSYVSSLY